MNIDKETQQLKELLDSFGDKKYAIIRLYILNEANKHVLSTYNKKFSDLALNLHSICNSLISVIKHYTPEYFIS